MDCCSDTSISFHYMYETETRKLHEIIKNSTDKNNISIEYIINELLKKN